MAASRLVLVALALAACSSAYGGENFDDVVQIAPDTYSISRIDRGGFVGNAGRNETQGYEGSAGAE